MSMIFTIFTFRNNCTFFNIFIDPRPDNALDIQYALEIVGNENKELAQYMQYTMVKKRYLPLKRRASLWTAWTWAVEPNNVKWFDGEIRKNICRPDKLVPCHVQLCGLSSLLYSPFLRSYILLAKANDYMLTVHWIAHTHTRMMETRKFFCFLPSHFTLL